MKHESKEVAKEKKPIIVLDKGETPMIESLGLCCVVCLVPFKFF